MIYVDALQAPCEFSFVDIGPSKSKGIDYNQAAYVSAIYLLLDHEMFDC